MSASNGYVVADVAEAERVADQRHPERHWPGLAGLPYFDASHHAALAAALDWEDTSMPPCVHLTAGEHALVDQLSPTLVELLARISDDSVPHLAAAWNHLLEEEGADRLENSKLEDLLRQLRDLAAQAKAEGKALLHWQAAEEDS